MELDIQTLVEDALQIVSLEAEKKGIELLCHVDPSVPQKIFGDQTRLRQILVNLLTYAYLFYKHNLNRNACKFSSKGDIIVRVSAKKSPNSESEYDIQFSVQDEGIGMSEEAKSKILSPFAQADATISRRFVRENNMIY